LIGPIVAKLRRIRPVDTAAIVAGAWFLVHAAVYVVRAWQTTHSLTHFFAWQLGVFVAVLLASAIFRPAVAGILVGIQLLISTLALVAISQDVSFAVRLIVVLLWSASAACGMKHVLARFVGPRYATWGVASATAFAALVPLCFLLGILHWMNPWVVAIVALATAVPGAIVISRSLPSLPNNVLQKLHNLDFLELCWIEAIWLILGVAFVGAGSSETRSDAVRVHLPYIHQLVQDQGFSHQYACWHRLQPMAAQSCYAAFATIGSDAAAKWLSWLALVALVVLIVDEVHRRSGSREMALFAGAVVLSCPVLIELATTLYIDHFVTLFCTAGFIVLFRALNPPCWRGILLSAAIMASMDQVKYPGLIFTAIWGLMLGVMLLRRCSMRRAIGWTLAGGATLVAAASPWYLYVYAGTGNPFYPYLHSLFPTPYWTNEIALHDVYEGFFKLSPGVLGKLIFPWEATYQTNRFFEGFNGFIGFWVIALAPCWFLARFVGNKNQINSRWWDLVFAGVVGVAGVVSYTPYVRYWLPVYPLLVIGCAVAALPLLARLRLEHPAPRAVFGIAFLGLLISPLPFNCQQSPWNEYSHKVTREQQLAQRFPGVEAVLEFNRSLGPDDGVLCTGYEGVCLVHGRPYEYNFWWNPVHHIHDVASFADFCRRNNVRYWIVDHQRTMLNGLDEGDLQSHYWTEARTVAARGTLTVYDVCPPQDGVLPPTFWYQLDAALENSPTDWKSTDCPAYWIPVSGNAAADVKNVKPTPARTAVLAAPDRQIWHRIPPTPNCPLVAGQMCTVHFDLNSSVSTYPLAEVYWYDAEGKVLDHVMGAGIGKSDYHFCVYSQIPPGADSGWVRLRTWQGAPVELTHGSVSYRPFTVPTAMAARNTRRSIR
jgi:hypothetical protein